MFIEIHPIASKFPQIDDDAYASLYRDIEIRGQNCPIVLFEGMIWDGRARFDVCDNLGLKPWLVPLRRYDAVRFFILANYSRVGEPNSEKRLKVVRILAEIDGKEHRTSARRRQKEWVARVRREFHTSFKGKREPCAVCKAYTEFVHAHHSFPLSLQFECGLEDAIHDYDWLCPTHHKDVHVLLSDSLFGTRHLEFTVPDEFAEEWLAIEAVASRGVRLCAAALGQDGITHKRCDPPFGRMVAINSLPLADEKKRRRVRGGSSRSIPFRVFNDPCVESPAA